MRFATLLLLVSLAACSHHRSRDADLSKAPVLPVQPRTVSLDDDVLPLGKLPTDVVPTAYTVSLSLDPAREDFSGDVAIHVTLTAGRESLWLHGQGLRVKRAQATLADGKVIKAVYEQMTPDGLARLSFAEPVPPQSITIAIAYDADYSKRLQGLYKVMVGTQPYVFAQFEAIAARQAFPCFDEPRFKTPFTISVVAPRFATVVSTTHVTGETLDIVQKRVHFADTPPLPTYLLTFAVGDFDVVDNGPLPASNVRTAPLPFRGIAVKGQGKLLKHAMANTGPILNELETYFGSPYAFDKLDIIAVPDFAAGAMENVGAITFRDGLLLHDDRYITVEQKRDFAETMAHELAHMWFGNVVTMAWWDDTWLNESFATWMGHRVERVVDPSADMSRVQETLGVMRLDALAAAQPVLKPIESSRDIATAFDGIAYEKGMGVLGMFETYVGEAVFRQAIQGYVEDHRFATATADDLLAALDHASGKPVSVAMRSFIEQPGVPLVDVSLSCEGKAALTLSQSRYLPLGSSGDAPRQWVIPVCARYDQTRGCWLLSERQQTFPLLACPTWFMPNDDAKGYFRFTPSKSLAKSLKHLKRTEMLAFADNLRAATAAGHATPDELLGSLEALAAQRDLYLDVSIDGVLQNIYDHHLDTANQGHFAALAMKTVGTRVDDHWLIGSARETDDEHEMRVDAVRFVTRTSASKKLEDAAADAGVTMVANLTRTGDFQAKETELADVTVGAALRQHKAKHDDVVAILNRSTDPTVRSKLVHALASVRDHEQVAKSLALVPQVRANELWSLAMPLASHPETRDQTWTWLTENFETVKARVPDDAQGYLIGFAHGFCSDERAAEVQAFFEPRADGLSGGRQALNETTEAIHLCAVRDREQHKAINDWLAARKQ